MLRKNKKLLIFIFLFVLILLIVKQPVQAVNSSADLLNSPTSRIMINRSIVGINNIGKANNLYGVIKIQHLMEMGIVITDFSYQNNIDTFFKARMLGERDYIPEISIGAYNSDLFVTASMYLGFNIDGHIGLFGLNKESLFFGLSKIINPYQGALFAENKGGITFPKIKVMAEYFEEQYNIGVRMNITPAVSVELGLYNFDNIKVGAAINF